MWRERGKCWIHYPESPPSSGGERGIRTLDRVSPIHAFQACAFNHSAISPVARGPAASIATLLINHGSVALADLAPAAVQALALIALKSAVGVLGREFLVDLDPPSRRFVHVEIPVLHRRAAAEDFQQTIIERRIFLDAKIGTNQVQRGVGSMPDGRNVARPVPRRAYAKHFRETRDFAAWRNAARLRHVNADEIDQPVADERRPLMRAVE